MFNSTYIRHVVVLIHTRNQFMGIDKSTYGSTSLFLLLEKKNHPKGTIEDIPTRHGIHNLSDANATQSFTCLAHSLTYLEIPDTPEQFTNLHGVCDKVYIVMLSILNFFIRNYTSSINKT
jgi:hypothetical protein